jgi:glutamate formiminotransferase
MIKSVVIRDKRDNRSVFRVICHKSGVYELTMDLAWDVKSTVEVRDERGRKVRFGGKEKIR